MFWAIRGGTNWCREGDIGNDGVLCGTCSNPSNLWGPFYTKGLTLAHAFA